MKRINSLIVIVLSITQTPWAQSNWQHVGPNFDHVGIEQYGRGVGRVECIAVDPIRPDTIYLGSNGGTWKSWDGGINWSNMDPNYFLPFSGASDMIVSSVTGNVFVACTDLNDRTDVPSNCGKSVGIYVYNRITSGWSLLNTLPTSCRINRLKFYPGNENIIFACTNGGLYRTTNGGTNWTIIDTTPIYNIVFLVNGATVYTYISGSKGPVFKESTNASQITPAPTFTNLSVVESKYLSAPILSTSNICAGDVSGTVKTIYIWVSEFDASNPTVHRLLKFTKDVNSGATTCAPYTTESFGGDYGSFSCDRFGLEYGNGRLYFGARYLHAWNTITNSALSETWIHDDIHYLKYIPSKNRMLCASDGGFSIYDFNSATPDNAIQRNLGLRISQVNGFSGASDQIDMFYDAEQDRPGVRFSNTINATKWADNENNGIIVNKFNNNLVIGKLSSYYNASYASSFTAMQPPPSSSSITYWPVPNSPTFTADLGNPETPVSQPSFYINTFFQDQGREKIYYGTTTFEQWDPQTGKFAVKIRPNVIFGDCSNPLRCSAWSGPISMAISPNDKNGLVFTTPCISTLLDNTVVGVNQRASQVIQYIGPNIDDSWVAHNEDQTNWKLITPNLNNVNGNILTLTNDQIFSVTFTSAAISPWDKNKIWVGCSSPSTTFVLPYKVLAYDGASQNWTDYSSGIPSDEIVHTMVMETGSNNGMYLGTNKSMYYRNSVMASWQPFVTNLPHLKTTQLEINYKENTVRAGTYGRGIWKSNLNCPGTLAEITYSASKEFKEGSPSVLSSGTITANGSDMVYYRGTDFVELKPGFNTVTGSNFLAYIHECNSTGNSPGMNMKIKNPNPESEVVNEIPEPNGMNIYPNPNQGIFSVNIQTESTNDMSIYDFLGRLVFTKNQLKGEIEIDLKGKPAGIYIVKAINNTNGKVEVRKIILENSQY